MIAKEVGITKPSIYYHFSSKEALIDRIFEYIFHDYHFNRFFQIDECDEENFAEKLYEGGLKMILGTNEIDVRVLHEFVQIAVRHEKYLERILKMEQEFVDGFGDLLQKGVELGVVSPENKETKAQLLACVLNSIQDYLMIQFQLGYQNVWKLAVNSVITKNKLEMEESETSRVG